MRKIRTYHDVEHETGSELLEQVVEQRSRLQKRMAGIANVIAVASGKGGVGKSAITANLAAALAGRGYRVGVVDADLNGPSLARMLGAGSRPLGDGGEGVEPATGVGGIRLMSMELLQNGEDAPLRWRNETGDSYLWQSSMETGVLREFLSDVVWGELDYLLIDVPPGTDKIARLLELLPGLDQAILVTSPSEMSRFIVSKSVRMVRDAGVKTIGLVSNMSEYVCPECGHRGALFHGDGAGRLSEGSGIDIWAAVPFDPALGRDTDLGRPPVVFDPKTAAARAIEQVAQRVERESGRSPSAEVAR
jgi:ATP-binding protein involved in chromosome partitioning